jgi:hypothetical protein
MMRLGGLFASLLCVSIMTGCASTSTQPLSWSDNLDETRLIVVTIRNERAPLVPRAGSTTRSYTGSTRYGVAPVTLAHSRSIAKTYKLREVTGWPIGLLGVHCLVYEIAAGSDRNAMLERLKRDVRVESAQPLHSFKTLTNAQADPYRPLQRNLDVMNVTRAHRWSRGEGIRIGIIDTGVDVTHPELTGRIVDYRDFVGSKARTQPDAHGTAVAGIIGASDRNALGIVGIAPAARLYALRACWPNEELASASCNTLTLAKALIAAIEAHVNIVNLSLAGPSDPLLARIVRSGIQRGVVFVGAAPAQLDNGFPTSIPGVIAVGALGNAGSADAMLFAPGEDVLTLTPNGSYDFLSGSSLAAASVTAAAAVLLARQPKLAAEDIRSLLTPSMRDEATQQTPRSVDLCAAMTRLLSLGSCD